MGYRNTQLATDSYYHVYNRGTEKRVIYKDHADYKRFLELLFICNSNKPINVRNLRRDYEDVFEYERDSPLVSIGAYCLMPNHFHLLITPVIEGGLTLFMRKLLTGYSMYFNKRYERTGSLFEGKFKAKHAESDEYLKYLFAYIHLNPVKLVQPNWKEKGMTESSNAIQYAKDYQYSSLKDYFSSNNESRSQIINPEAFPDYFPTINEIEVDLLEWLNYESCETL